MSSIDLHTTTSAVNARENWIDDTLCSAHHKTQPNHEVDKGPQLDQQKDGFDDVQYYLLGINHVAEGVIERCRATFVAGVSLAQAIEAAPRPALYASCALSVNREPPSLIAFYTIFPVEGMAITRLWYRGTDSSKATARVTAPHIQTEGSCVWRSWAHRTNHVLL